jgi:hypothetical protein
MRYRKPSIKTIFGITKAKRKIKKDLGIYEVTKIINTPQNAKRKVKRDLGYESVIMRIFRYLRSVLK